MTVIAHFLTQLALLIVRLLTRLAGRPQRVALPHRLLVSGIAADLGRHGP